jgi:hypothetical protein
MIFEADFLSIFGSSLKSLALLVELEIEPKVWDFDRARDPEIYRYRSQNRPKHWRI